MSTPVRINIELVAPIQLSIALAPHYYIGTAQIGPVGEKGDQGIQGIQGQPGETMWEAETLTTIRPINEMQVNCTHLTGQIEGGLFQP